MFSSTIHAVPSTDGKLKDNSLSLAGYGYLVGDAALFAAGLMEKNYKNAGAGLLWGLGGVAAARYGSPNANAQLKLLSQRFGAYLQKQGIEIPADPTTQRLMQPGGVISQLDAFLYQYPSQALNAVYGIGATQLLASGVKRGFMPDIASGLLIGAGALAGLLIPEKKIDPQHPPQGFLQKTVAWAQEKPLLVSSLAYNANNIAMIWGAMVQHKTHPTSGSHWMRYATAASYIFGNAMLAMSSKAPIGNSNADITAPMTELSARVVAAQPPDLQDALIQNIAGYLAGQPEIHQTPDAIAKILKGRLKEMLPSVDKWQHIVRHDSLASGIAK